MIYFHILPHTIHKYQGKWEGKCMQTSVVIGAFQFIGFHIAKYLLDLGEAVIGIDWEETSDEAMLYKEMEIGRNSNFLYIPLQSLHHTSVIQPKTIYISCYDLSKSCIADKQAIIQQIIAFLKAVEVNYDAQILLLLPIEEERSIFDPLLQVVEDNNAAKLVYAPTVYGPWQPETMSFEATIRQKALSEIESAIEKEDKSDALFISDIIEILSEITSHHEKKIQLQSEAPDQWQQCAKLLWKDEWVRTYLLESCSQPIKGCIYKVINKTSPTEGILLQKKHVQYKKMISSFLSKREQLE